MFVLVLMSVCIVIAAPDRKFSVAVFVFALAVLTAVSSWWLVLSLGRRRWMEAFFAVVGLIPGFAFGLSLLE